MAATELSIERPWSTTDRVIVAWSNADAMARRALVAAMLTTVLVALAVPSSLSIRFGLMVSGIALLLAALVDVHEHKLPNRLIAMGCCAAFVGPFLAGDRLRVLDAVIGAVVAGGAMFVVRLARGVGLGDVKAATMIGASVAPLTPVAAPVAIAVTAALAATYGSLARRSHLALGPCLWLGWAIAVAASRPLGRWWA